MAISESDATEISLYAGLAPFLNNTENWTVFGGVSGR